MIRGVYKFYPLRKKRKDPLKGMLTSKSIKAIGAKSLVNRLDRFFETNRGKSPWKTK